MDSELAFDDLLGSPAQSCRGLSSITVPVTMATCVLCTKRRKGLLNPGLNQSAWRMHDLVML